MSYILEALRRAETERERKRRVPGLHAQPVPVPGDEQAPRRGSVWPWLALGVIALLLLPLLWRWWANDPVVEEALATRAAVAGNVTPGAAPAVEPAPAAPVAETAAPAAPPERAATPPAHKAPPAAKPAPKHEPDSAPRGSTAARPPATPKAAAADPARAAAARDAAGTAPTPSSPSTNTPASATAPEPRVRSLAELPEDLKRSVPQLSFGGSVYSEIASQRMVILNGQVLREGDSVTDELQLEQIRPRSAVMRVRGQRFEIPF